MKSVESWQLKSLDSQRVEYGKGRARSPKQRRGTRGHTTIILVRKKKKVARTEFEAANLRPEQASKAVMTVQ